jgi:hypothetical protein
VKNEGVISDEETTVADDGTDGLGPLRNRAQVRIFTLADYVAEEESGKLYISGAGLEWTGVPVSAGKIGSCYLVIRLAYPRAFARSSHSVVVRIVDVNGKPAGPNPLLQAEMKFNLHRVPSNFTEVWGTLPIQITDYPLSTETLEVIFLNLEVDGTLVSQLPVDLRYSKS